MNSLTLRPYEGSLAKEDKCLICWGRKADEENYLVECVSKKGNVNHIFHKECIISLLKVKPVCPYDGSHLNIFDLLNPEEAALEKELRRTLQNEIEVEENRRTRLGRVCRKIVLIGLVLFFVLCAIQNCVIYYYRKEYNIKFSMNFLSLFFSGFLIFLIKKYLK